MPTIRVVSWNIENWGTKKYEAGAIRTAMINFVARAIRQMGAHVVGIMEVRENLGGAIATALANRLNVIAGPAGRWQARAAGPWVNNRWEEYVYVWDTQVVTLQGALQDTYANPNAPPARIGFPRQVASDRPPLRARFESVANNAVLVDCGLFHAPEPGYRLNVKKGCMALATVPEFLDAATTCVLMGDFNVKADSNAYNAWRGQEAFGNLVARGFTQSIPGPPPDTGCVLTSLIKSGQAWVGMNFYPDGFSEPYDNLFIRLPNPNPNNVRMGGGGLEDLLRECAQGGPLEAYLRRLERARTGAAPAHYPLPEDVFVPYRRHVSDHMPVSIDVSW